MISKCLDMELHSSLLAVCAGNHRSSVTYAHKDMDLAVRFREKPSNLLTHYPPEGPVVYGPVMIYFFITYPKCWINGHVVMPWCTYDVTVTFQGLLNHFIWTSMSAALKKAFKINHSLTHLSTILNYMVYPMKIHLASFVTTTKYETNYIYIYSHHCPADVLAPLGARTSAGTVMNKWWHIQDPIPVYVFHPHLTHCGLVMPYGNIELDQHWLRQWLVAWWHQDITWTNVNSLAPGRFQFNFR